MSLCLVLQGKEYLYIGSDTAASTIYKGVTYRVTDYVKKIFPIDSNKILFFGGDANLGYEILEEFMSRHKHNIKTLVEVSKKKYKIYKIDKSINTIEEVGIRLVFAEFRGGRPIVYQIASKEDFQIHKSVIYDDNTSVIAQGYKMNECTDIVKEIATPTIEVKDIFQQAFDRVSCSSVGGSVIVYFLDKKGHVLCYENKVNDKEDILRYNLPNPINISKLCKFK